MTILVKLYSVLSLFFYPVIFVLILLIISLYIKKLRWLKLIILLAIITLYLLSTGMVTNYFLKKIGGYQTVSEQAIEQHRALILLGGGLDNTEGSLTPTMVAYSRITEAYRIYHLAKEKGIRYTVIISGGDPYGFGTSEASVYGNLLQQLGVLPEDIILEGKSHNTYQNAEFTKKITAKLPFEHYLLVTSGIHMRRSLLYFGYLGIEVIPAISDNPSVGNLWVPSAYNLALMQMIIHEALGMVCMSVYHSLGLNNK